MLVAIIAALSWAPQNTLKTQSFDNDPLWQASGNLPVTRRTKAEAQDFGFSPTSYAADSGGEIGGRIFRAAKPCYCGVPIKASLEDSLSATGTFALTQSTSASGLFFGWTNSRQTSSGRPMNSLGLQFDAERSGARLAVRLITGDNRSCGTFITPFVPGGYRPTPIRTDGTRYRWTLLYNPAGQGEFTFNMRSLAKTHEDFEGKNFTVPLPAGFKKNTEFDLFGMMNMTRPGGSLSAYFGDLELGGHPLDLKGAWRGNGNRQTYQTDELPGQQDFGWSQTSFAGGSPGEIGGVFWRAEGLQSFYAADVGRLSTSDRLEASGRLNLVSGAPDSGMAFGWFDPVSFAFIGAQLGGPTRVGHYLLPSYELGGDHGRARKGPVVMPGKAHSWTMLFEPGVGTLTVTLDGQSAVVTVPVHRSALSRFGLFTIHPGGGQLKMYMDDIRYSAGR